MRRYQRDGEDRKLAELEQTWPEKLRARMGVEAVVGVQVFGSRPARAGRELAGGGGEGRLRDHGHPGRALRGQVRRELGPREGDGTLPESVPGEAEETGSPPVEAEATGAREVDAETAGASEAEKVKAAAGVSAEEQG